MHFPGANLSNTSLLGHNYAAVSREPGLSKSKENSNSVAEIFKARETLSSIVSDLGIEYVYKRLRDKQPGDEVHTSPAINELCGQNAEAAKKLDTLIAASNEEQLSEIREFVTLLQTAAKNAHNSGVKAYTTLEFVTTLSLQMAKHGSIKIVHDMIEVTFPKPKHTEKELAGVEDLNPGHHTSIDITLATNEYSQTKQFRNLTQNKVSENPSLKILHINAQGKEDVKLVGACASIQLPISDAGDASAKVPAEHANLIFEAIETGYYNVLAVNCRGGLSRSAAVNFALSCIYNHKTITDITTQMNNSVIGEDRQLQCNPLTFNSMIDAANKRYGLNLEQIPRENFEQFRVLGYTMDSLLNTHTATSRAQSNANLTFEIQHLLESTINGDINGDIIVAKTLFNALYFSSDLHKVPDGLDFIFKTKQIQEASLTTVCYITGTMFRDGVAHSISSRDLDTPGADERSAKFYFQEGANLGCIRCSDALTNYRGAKPVQENFEQALLLMDRIVPANAAEARNTSENVSKADIIKALVTIKQAALAGNLDAICRLGELSLTGLTIDGATLIRQSFYEAKEFFTRAADQGHPKSAWLLTRFCSPGKKSEDKYFKTSYSFDGGNHWHYEPLQTLESVLTGNWYFPLAVVNRDLYREDKESTASPNLHTSVNRYYSSNQKKLEKYAQMALNGGFQEAKNLLDGLKKILSNLDSY